MRLLYLTRCYSAHDARWLRVFAQQGNRMGFLPLQGVNSVEFGRHHPDVELLGSPSLPAMAESSLLDAVRPAVRQQILEWNPEVIVAGPLTDAGYLAAEIAPELTVFMSWAFDVLHEARVDAGAAERLAQTLGAARYVFTDCASVLAACESVAGRSLVDSCVVPWGLNAADKPVPNRGWRVRLGDEANKVVLSPRGFTDVHRPDVVIDSFARAHARDESLRLWLPGSGVLREQTERHAVAAGVAGAVRFLGRLEQADLAGCFAEADAYLSCADSDGTSLSLLQAMHAGLPCIVTDLPGNREWVAEPDAWLAPAGRTNAFARGLGEALRRPEQSRLETAARQRVRVAQRADLAANLPRLAELLRAVANGARVRCRPLLAV